MINEIITVASSAYSDNYIADMYWDFDKSQPKHNEEGGDSLAEFIAIEIADTYDESASDDDQLGEAIRVVETASRQLSDVAEALYAEQYQRTLTEN